MISELEDAYMIICTDSKTGEKYWHSSGRGCTPFTTNNFGRAKGELTRCGKCNWFTCELVKISDIERM